MPKKTAGLRACLVACRVLYRLYWLEIELLFHWMVCLTKPPSSSCRLCLLFISSWSLLPVLLLPSSRSLCFLFLSSSFTLRRLPLLSLCSSSPLLLLFVLRTMSEHWFFSNCSALLFCLPLKIYPRSNAHARRKLCLLVEDLQQVVFTHDVLHTSRFATTRLYTKTFRAPCFYTTCL